MPKTKRQTLACVAEVYDPLGLIAPMILPAKLFLQSLWKKKMDWDTEFSNEEQQSIQKILRDWESEEQITVPRKASGKFERKELHVFTDASEVAYAAAVYLKPEAGKPLLIYSKSRLCPINGNLTVPKKELLGVTVGVRAAKFVLEQLAEGPKRIHI